MPIGKEAQGRAMLREDLQITARTARHLIHPLLLPFPIACLGGALLTDVTFWRTAEMMWADFSAWLVSAGVILGFIVAIIFLFDVLTGRFAGRAAPLWPYAVGSLIALVLAVLNMLIHTRDAWTSVVPWGLALSAATVLVLLATLWAGWPLIFRREVEVVTREVDVEVVTR
jgi:uncharacterized membrane protein